MTRFINQNKMRPQFFTVDFTFVRFLERKKNNLVCERFQAGRELFRAPFTNERLDFRGSFAVIDRREPVPKEGVVNEIRGGEKFWVAPCSAQLRTSPRRAPGSFDEFFHDLGFGFIGIGFSVSEIPILP